MLLTYVSEYQILTKWGIFHKYSRYFLNAFVCSFSQKHHNAITAYTDRWHNCWSTCYFHAYQVTFFIYTLTFVVSVEIRFSTKKRDNTNAVVNVRFRGYQLYSSLVNPVWLHFFATHTPRCHVRWPSDKWKLILFTHVPGEMPKFIAKPKRMCLYG